MEQSIVLEEGDLRFFPHFYQKTESDQFFQILQREIQWQHEQVVLFGKSHFIPRLSAWYGDRGRSYTYSNLRMEPLPWIPKLWEIKQQLEKYLDLNFNSVLLNLYRNGQDHVSWHSDDEKELGHNPTIASISFGGTRRFLMSHKTKPSLAPVELLLNHGSLLIMQGQTQHFWKHKIAKTSKTVSPRINLTFRTIQ